MKSNHFEVAGSLEVEDVPDVRRFVEKLHRRVVTDPDDISRVIMAAHELLENAVKYSADGTATLQIDVRDGDKIAITTKNRARREDLAGLEALARELRSVTDPMAFYVELMGRAPERRGGLGLGRVAAEGEMTVELQLDGDMVSVRAESTFGRQPT